MKPLEDHPKFHIIYDKIGKEDKSLAKQRSEALSPAPPERRYKEIKDYSDTQGKEKRSYLEVAIVP